MISLDNHLSIIDSDVIQTQELVISYNSRTLILLIMIMIMIIMINNDDNYNNDSCPMILNNIFISVSLSWY